MNLALPEGTPAAALYASLRTANPGAFAGIAELGGLTILSSSPERLVRVRGRRLDTRPIAGTRPRRGGTDATAIAELTGSPKVQAEHVMLIDLERDDLGRAISYEFLGKKEVAPDLRLKKPA